MSNSKPIETIDLSSDDEDEDVPLIQWQARHGAASVAAMDATQPSMADSTAPPMAASSDEMEPPSNAVPTMMPDEAQGLHRANIEQQAANAGVGVYAAGRFGDDGAPGNVPNNVTPLDLNADEGEPIDNRVVERLNEVWHASADEAVEQVEAVPVNTDTTLVTMSELDKQRIKEAKVEALVLANAPKGSMERNFLDACENLGKRVSKPAHPKSNAEPDDDDMPDDIDQRKLYKAYLLMQEFAKMQYGTITHMAKYMPSGVGWIHGPLPDPCIKRDVDPDEEDSDSDDDDLADEAFNAEAEEQRAEQEQSAIEMETDMTWSEDAEVAKDKARLKRKRIGFRPVPNKTPRNAMPKCKAMGPKGGKCRRNASPHPMHQGMCQVCWERINCSSSGSK